MAWVYILIAGLLEIVWAYFMKQSEGFTRLWPSVATLAFMAARRISPAFWTLSGKSPCLPPATTTG